MTADPDFFEHLDAAASAELEGTHSRKSGNRRPAYVIIAAIILAGLAVCLWLGFSSWANSETAMLEQENVSPANTVQEREDSSATAIYGREIPGLPEFCADKLVSVSGCNGQTEITTDQGNTYRLVEIGDQCWFADNSKEIPATNEGWYGYYDNAEEEPSPGDGLLYTWDAAMNGETHERAQGVCPDGWHVPSDCEFGTIDKKLDLRDYGKISRTISISKIDKLYTDFTSKNLSGWKTPYEYFDGRGVSLALWTSNLSNYDSHLKGIRPISRFYYKNRDSINVTRPMYEDGKVVARSMRCILN